MKPPWPSGSLERQLALIPSLLRKGDRATATHEAIVALRETFGLEVTTVHFTQDEYSLNSVSGRAVLSDGTVYFFKFHQEEGEEENVAEYYRAQLLVDAGLPVEAPVAASTTPGAQMVLYPWHSEPRMADICADLERLHGPAASLGAELLAARRAMDARIGKVLLESLAPPVATSAAGSVHQLFYHRLADPRPVPRRAVTSVTTKATRFLPTWRESGGGSTASSTNRPWPN